MKRCIQCLELFSPHRIKNKRKFCSASCYNIYQIGKPHGHKTNNGKTPWNKGTKNQMFKGTHSQYTALHNWVSRKLGKPNTCIKCNKVVNNPHGIHWANVSKEYRRDLKDWVRLCVKCHHAFDDSVIDLAKVNVRVKRINNQISRKDWNKHKKVS